MEVKASLRRRFEEEAEKELRRSVELLATLHDPFELAVSQRALAILLLRQVTAQADQPARTARVREAEVLLEAALETFSRPEAYAKIELQKTRQVLNSLPPYPLEETKRQLSVAS